MTINQGIEILEELLNNKDYPRLCCCIPNQGKLDECCQEKAEYEIWFGNTPNDFIDSCFKHIPELMTDSPEHRLIKINK